MIGVSPHPDAELGPHLLRLLVMHFLSHATAVAVSATMRSPPARRQEAALWGFSL